MKVDIFQRFLPVRTACNVLLVNQQNNSNFRTNVGITNTRERSKIGMFRFINKTDKNRLL